MSRTLVAVVSDLHVNSTVGLSLPRFTKDDGEIVLASRAQEWLYSCWLDYWQSVFLTRQPGDTLYVVVNGDVTDGCGHHDTHQSVSYNPRDEVDHAVQILKPIREACDEMFIVRGTGVHVGKGASQEEEVASHLNVQKDGHRHTWAFLPIEVEGVLFHFTHHGRVPKSLLTRNSTASKIASEHYYRSLALGRRPADIKVRSHAHRFADSGVTLDTRTLQTPCWQLSSQYGIENFPDELDFPDIGGLLFGCSDNTYTFDWIGRNRYIVEPKPVWKSSTQITPPRPSAAMR